MQPDGSVVAWRSGLDRAGDIVRITADGREERLVRTGWRLEAGLSAAGGRIALANADAGIQGLFRTTSLDRRFPIYNDVPSALANVERGTSLG